MAGIKCFGSDWKCMICESEIQKFERKALAVARAFEFLSCAIKTCGSFANYIFAMYFASSLKITSRPCAPASGKPILRSPTVPALPRVAT